MALKTRIRGAFAPVNEARLYYAERGAGFPLIFIPGGSVDASHYAAVAERLADDFRTVTFDRRGNGRSTRPAGWYATSIAEQADDVAGLIEALGLAPCAVWAGSLGGVILLELLIRRPGLVSAAVVHEPPLFGVLDDGEQLAAGQWRLRGGPFVRTPSATHFETTPVSRSATRSRTCRPKRASGCSPTPRSFSISKFRRWSTIDPQARRASSAVSTSRCA